jgi:hypothetical protein
LSRWIIVATAGAASSTAMAASQLDPARGNGPALASALSGARPSTS